METAVHYQRGGDESRVKHAVPTQNTFRHVTARAESVGMRVNASKTRSLCVSDALKFRPEAYFLDREGERINAGGSLKMLGFHFSSKPTVARHLEVLRRRFRSRYWVLRHLRACGFSEAELVKVYKTVVRPVADYMAVVYLSLIHI